MKKTPPEKKANKKIKVKVIYDVPDYLKHGGGLIFSYGPESQRVHDAMRKAGKVAPLPKKPNDSDTE